MIRTTSIIVACALGTSVLAAAAMQSGQQRQQQPQQDRSAQHERDYEVTTLEGKIVDLYHFMKANDEDRKNLESAAYNGKATGGPVALVVVRDRRILPDTEEVYIILGAPEEMSRPAIRPGQQPGQQQHIQAIQQELQQSFTRLGVDRQHAQQLAQQLAQGILREQPSQQELREMLQREFTRAGASQQQAQQEAQRVAPQIQQHVTREGQPGQRDYDDYDRDRSDQHQRTGEVPSNEICKRAMKMVGQTVRISGTELERGNLQAIVARNIQPIAGETPADQRRDRDRNPVR